MPMGIDDNYNGVPNEAEAKGSGDPKAELMDLLGRLSELVGELQAELQPEAAMPPVDAAVEPAAEAPAPEGDLKSKLMALTKKRGSAPAPAVGM